MRVAFFFLSCLLKVTEHLSLIATTVYVSHHHGYSNWLEQWVWPGWFTFVPLHISCISLWTATSSTRLEDLSYLDSQRAAGHRGSVRKHNTAGRTNDDSKGILVVLPLGEISVQIKQLLKLYRPPSFMHIYSFYMLQCKKFTFLPFSLSTIPL